jgi:predicted transposase/invertase (TIGR01784 family)
MSLGPIIRKTEERLEWLSGDEDTIRLYEARENSRLERDSIVASAMSKGIAKGKEEGIEEGIAKVASSMLKEGFNIEQISSVTGMPTEEILKLNKKLES